MICPKCGAYIPNEIKFCPNCGIHISKKISANRLWKILLAISVSIGALGILTAVVFFLMVPRELNSAEAYAAATARAESSFSQMESERLYAKFQEDSLQIARTAGIGEVARYHVLGEEWDSQANSGRIYIGEDTEEIKDTGMVELFYCDDKVYNANITIFNIENNTLEIAAWSQATLWVMAPELEFKDLDDALIPNENWTIFQNDSVITSSNNYKNFEIVEQVMRSEDTGTTGELIGTMKIKNMSVTSCGIH